METGICLACHNWRNLENEPEGFGFAILDFNNISTPAWAMANALLFHEP